MPMIYMEKKRGGNKHKKPEKMELKNSKVKGKRYAATFYDSNGEKIKTTNFGAKYMDSYPIHHDDARRQRFRDRFGKLIHKDSNDITKPITLADRVLWNRKTVRESLRDIEKTYAIKTIDKRTDEIR